MRWINFMHFYQPANGPSRTVREAADRCYSRILKNFEQNSGFKATVNIAGCLLLRLDELGYGALIDRLKRIVAKNQIELVGSASYHALLPLVPRKEAERQIKEQEVLLWRYLGARKPSGFFSPEFAWNKDIGSMVKALGYDWILLDEVSLGKGAKNIPGPIASDPTNGLKYLIRAKKISQTYIPETVLKLSARQNPDSAEMDVVTASDAELYGLRHQDLTGKLEKAAGSGIKTLLASELIALSEKIPAIEPIAASWETSRRDLNAGQPFRIWHDPKNPVHTLLWRLAGLAYSVIEKFPDDANSGWMRKHYAQGLASCTFWWASGRDFSHVFGPLAWSPDEIMRGATDLIRSIRSIEDAAARTDKLEAEKIFATLEKAVWTRHWKKFWKTQL